MVVASVLLGAAMFGGCSNGNATSDGGTCGSAGTLCGSSCVDLQSDNANCGACGTACGAGQVCSQGKCATSCGGGTKACGSICADTQHDPKNCGNCNTKCATGQVCSNGACGTTCANGQSFCGGDSGAPYCANTQTDNANCGGCGATCGTGQVCNGGTCSNSCGGDDAGTDTLCTSDAGPPYCANTQSDNQNCGGCGIACGTGMVCQSGACANACAASDGGLETLCMPDAGPPYCADTNSDNDNCGSCGMMCTGSESCISGVCKTTGDAGSCDGNYTCGTALTITGTGGFYGNTCCSNSTSPAVSCGGNSSAPVIVYAWKNPVATSYYMTVSTGFAWQGMITTCGNDFGCGNPSSSYGFGGANTQMYFSVQATTATCGPFEFKICTTSPCTLP